MAVTNASPSRINLFLVAEKGCRVLQHIVAHLDATAIALVVSARDKQMARDYYDEIGQLCAQENIPFQSRAPPRRLRAGRVVAVVD